MTETVERTVGGTRYAWHVQPGIPLELREQLQGSSIMLAHLLYCRGYRTSEEIEGFFTAGPVGHDPFDLPDMAAAVERIRTAVSQHEKVAIFGDFDCDGLTATAVLRETLMALGLDPYVHIPSREAGHGLDPQALALAREEGASLLITGDCGVTAVEEVRLARELGMDVIVTDHHEPRPDGSLPDAMVVAPTRHDSVYPFRSLCGVGVAYKLAQALARDAGGIDVDELLDLVAIGTIADVVPLLDENRSLVIAGLKCLRRTTRPGLLALFQAAKIDRSRIDPTGVGFYLAPRINAANRMASPQIAYDLITADDPPEAARLAAELDTRNDERQLLVAEKFQEVANDIGDPGTIVAQIRSGERPPMLLVIGDWPPGISGLIASRLVETYGTPALVGTYMDDGNITVSARGIKGMRVDELLELCHGSVPGGLFLGHGGHAGAGGFRVEILRIDDTRAALDEMARLSIPVDVIGNRLEIDAEVALDQLSFQSAKLIESLAPFGTGFPEPLFLSRRVRLKYRKQVGDGQHFRITVQQGSSQLDALYFNADPALTELEPGQILDIVYHLQLNRWDGLLKPELVLKDWRVSR